MNIGFIVLRHVNSITTNIYWQESYDRIRQYYPENNIVIIDDNSNYNYITEKVLYKTIIIKSEYHSRGELLPYYYFLKYKFFDIAVILHDSVFINKYIDFRVDRYKLIWDFPSNHCNYPNEETKFIKALNNSEELLEFYNHKNLWAGCFGVMTIIDYEYLQFIDSKYNIANLLPYVTSRDHRMVLERVMACILQANYKQKTLLGSILNYCTWSYTYDNYIRDKDNIKLPLIKVWTGR